MPAPALADVERQAGEREQRGLLRVAVALRVMLRGFAGDEHPLDGEDADERDDDADHDLDQARRRRSGVTHAARDA